MAAVFWIFLALYPFVAQSQSGDDDIGECSEPKCWSLMTLTKSSLVCSLNEYDYDMCENFVTLCVSEQNKDGVCSNKTLENNRFTFENVSPLSKYNMYIKEKAGGQQRHTIDLRKMVKIMTPEIDNATYYNDEAVIYIRCIHDYVKDFDFHLEFWGEHAKVKEKMRVKHQPIRIQGDKLRNYERYKIHIRAKPSQLLSSNDSWSGSWTGWSPVKHFEVNHHKLKECTELECWGQMTVPKSSLFCSLNEYDYDMCENFVTLCVFQLNIDADCSNKTLENNRFTFENVSPLSKYNMYIKEKAGGQQRHTIDLRKMVKIMTPEIDDATYNNDEAVIYIKSVHDYVKDFDFHLEFWGEHAKVKEKILVNHQPIRIGGDKLREYDRYNVRVRAKPGQLPPSDNYWSGSWTVWSPTKHFEVKHHEPRKGSESSAYILFILIPITIIAMVLVRWRKEIYAYIFPAVPDPKATLAQIHRQKEHSLVSFSPEIFKDITIYPVIYAEEKQFSPDTGDDQGDTTESCDDEVAALKCSHPTSVCDKQDEDDQSLDSETSHLKIKLLDECASAEDVHDNPGCQSVAALQRNSRDETYVTMSSLYKTQ